jgi:glycosyltransferase involved in cell wall biosynthesis
MSADALDLVAGRPLVLGDPAEFHQPRPVDVLIPTRDRPAELATTLAGLAAQTDAPPFAVVVSDQSDRDPPWHHPAVASMVRALRHQGRPVLLRQNLPRRGMAHQRGFLLAHSDAQYVLNLDDDVWLAPGSLARLHRAITELGCGFVGNGVHGLSYLDDVRPEQQSAFEAWTGPVTPEHLEPGDERWRRHQVHNAANLLHVTADLGLHPDEWRAYKVAWIGACVLYDRAKLIACGGFDFWRQLPPAHAGEDVAAQLAVMRRFGGAGIVPSGAYHLETPTTIIDRGVQCYPATLPIGEGVPG